MTKKGRRRKRRTDANKPRRKQENYRTTSITAWKKLKAQTDWKRNQETFMSKKPVEEKTHRKWTTGENNLIPAYNPQIRMHVDVNCKNSFGTTSIRPLLGG